MEEKDKKKESSKDSDMIHFHYSPSIWSEITFLIAVVLVCATVIYVHQSHLTVSPESYESRHLRSFSRPI